MKIKKYANVLCFHTFNYIGGTEAYIYEMVCKYAKTHDITIFYVDSKSETQLERIRAVLGNDRVIKYNKPYQTIYCDRAFLNYSLEPFIDNIIADEVIDVVHANFYLQDFKIPQHPKIDKYLGVSESVCDGFKKQCKKHGLRYPIEVCYNPIEIRPQDKKQALLLVSATRLAKEKGLERMQILASELDKNNIPYQWLVFTYEKDEIQNKNVHYVKPTLDIRPYLKMATYVVQLSSSEGYCYTILESLLLGTPVIVTELDTFKEMGVKNGENGYLLPLDMSNIPVQDIYENIPNFSYQEKNDNYLKYLSTKKTRIEEVKSSEVTIVEPFIDYEEHICYVTPFEYGLSKINRINGFENRPIPINVEFRKKKANLLIKSGYAERVK